MLSNTFQLHVYTLATFCGLNVLFTSAQNNPIIFPTGAKSLFIGHSFFVPIAKTFDFFASSMPGAFPNHDVQVFGSSGESGIPLKLWRHHKDDIEPMLATGEVELFGMTVGSCDVDADGHCIDGVYSNDKLNAYKDWIDLALSYNPDTSIYIGVPWKGSPSSFHNAAEYMEWIQHGGELVFKFIDDLRSLYPNTDIHFLNYGIVAGEMRNLFEQDKLVGIVEMIKDQADDDSSLFVDQKGHPGDMLKELAALTWLTWFYGVPVNDIVNKIDQSLGWDKQNVVDILTSAVENNKDYRLYEASPHDSVTPFAVQMRRKKRMKRRMKKIRAIVRDIRRMDEEYC